MSMYAVVDPATGETLKEYTTITDDELRDAIARADGHTASGRELRLSLTAPRSCGASASCTRNVGRSLRKSSSRDGQAGTASAG